MSLAGRLWQGGATAQAPLLPLYLRARARYGKERPERLAERRGAGAARPPGRLIWLHAASVGETLSVLPLLEALAERAPDLSLLVTTGTVTAAELLAQRAPAALQARLQHRFLPLDVPGWAARFLEGWRPDLGVLVESELWPNLIRAARARGLPLALVNARLSARSAKRWHHAAALAGELLGSFRLVLAQSAADAERLAALGAPSPQAPGNLKDAAPPLPVDEAELARLSALLAGRPVFLAASTHPGEEALAFAAQRQLLGRWPDLLTVVVPRHPARGPAVAEAARAAGLLPARRAAGELPGPETTTYVADTLGELGLFYRLAQACLVGGSLVPHGGQNPREPALLGCPILLGEHMFNFAGIVARLEAARACIRIAGPDLAAALAAGVVDVLSDSGRAQAMAEAAAATAAHDAGLPGRIADALLAMLPEPPLAGVGLGEKGSVTA